MRRMTACALLLIGCAVGAGAQVNAPTPILPTTIQWDAAPAVPGLESAWFIGGPASTGVYAQRVKLPKGARIPPHTHPDERFSTVLSGTIYVGFGETFDESKVVAIPAGGVYVAPARVPHYVWAKDGDAVYQESGIGPTATDIIKR